MKNEREDIRYLKKQLFTQNGTPPSAIDEEDYIELLEVLSSKPREDRTVSSAEAHRRMREGG